MDVGARYADEADLPRVLELHQEGVEHVSQRRGGRLLAARPGPERLGEVVAGTAPASRAVLGTLDGEPVALGVAHVEELSDRTSLGVVDSLFVEPPARGVGVGERVVEVLVGWLGEMGCSGVDASALPGDRATKSFLEGSGFKARLLVLHRELGT